MGQIIKENVDRKYKISFFKGVQLILESVILLILMISAMLKANVISLIYLIFILKYMVSYQKSQLLVRLCIYISSLLFIQYMLFVLNLTAQSSPCPYPSQFHYYPQHYNLTTNQTIPYSEDSSIKYAIPIFFHYETFRDLKLSYLIGVGIDQD